MNNFDDGEDQGFFITMSLEIPLGSRQCDLLLDLLREKLEPNIFDQIDAVGHDHYGSFKIFTKPGVDITDELKETVLQAGENLFYNINVLHNFYDYLLGCDMASDDSTDVAHAVNYYCHLHYECGYDLPKPKELIAELVDYGLPEKDVEQAVFVELLKGEAA